MLPAPWTPRPRPPRLGNRCAIPTAPTAHRRAVREERKHHARACARARRQTILAVPTAWPLFKRSSVAAFERSVTCISLPAPAGSLIVLLLWVYYSAQILFFGAEFSDQLAADFLLSRHVTPPLFDQNLLPTSLRTNGFSRSAGDGVPLRT